MLNVLGEEDGEAGSAAAKALLDRAYATPGWLGPSRCPTFAVHAMAGGSARGSSARLGTDAGATVHWYGKQGFSKNRKVGHITIVAASSEEAVSRLAAIEQPAADSLKRLAVCFKYPRV